MKTQQYDATHSDDELALALRVIYKRISSLPTADRNDLKELFAEFAEALAVDDDERSESARKAIEEILNGAPSKVIVMEIPEGTGKLRKWAEHIGKKTKQLRGAAGLTQEQLAEKTGIAQSYISRLEKCQHTPNALTLQKLAKGLGVPLSKLDFNAPDEVTVECGSE